MHKHIVWFLVFFTSCLNISNDSFDAKKTLTGNWLILYPQHILKNEAQRNLYGRSQDSIVNLMGLKLVSFQKDGRFSQTDSLFRDPGTWSVTDSGNIKIMSAGRGFENFNGNIVGVLHDTILIEEMIPLDTAKIKLIWHLKKVENNDEAAALFQRSNNLWRQKPVKKETGDGIKKRVIAMLEYYSLYYKIVSVESIYFSRARVFLPFTYYQHGVGLTGFDPAAPFADIFFDEADAKTGYDMIRLAFENTKDEDFPSGRDFVVEYSRYFEKLATELKR